MDPYRRPRQGAWWLGRRGRRLGLLALAAALGAAALVAWRPTRVAAQTLLLLPAAFPGAPVDPLVALTAPPRRSEHVLNYAAGTVDADLYRPSGEGRRGGVILLLGARPVPRRDPVLVRFAEALARSGLLVLVPESSNLLVGRILPEELEALRLAFDLLAAQPDADPARLGFVGFSIGGGLSVAAAAQPALRERVRFVNSLGGYFDAARLVLDVTSRSIEVDGRVQPWQPSPLTLEVLVTQVVETLPAGPDRDLLARAYVERAPLEPREWDALSPAGRDVRRLLEGVGRDEARALLAGLPSATHERLRAISPSAHLAGLRARLFLMHDTADTYIPYTESRALAAAAPAGTLGRHTEFSIFQHVIPDKPVPWQTFLPDLWALYRHMHSVLLEAL